MTELQTTNPSSKSSNVPLHIGSLNPKVYQECEKFRVEIMKLRRRIEKHEPIPPGDFFETGFYLTSFRTYLTDHLLGHEAAYRDAKVAYMSVENSVAAADNKAKTHPSYRAYKYLERMDKLADEFTKFIKKFEGRMLDDGRM
jgi:hypothetical protein